MARAKGDSNEPTPSGSFALRNALIPLPAAVALGLFMHLVIGPACGPYATRLLLDVGIAIIAAVSLNIVNGFTGQFSVGHAAFMAAGGYVAGAITYYSSLLWWGEYAKHGCFLGVGEWLFFGSCLLGGIAAAVLGWLVGLPSLRLRGDYLAIVTLGFGEILRVLLQNTNRQIFDLDQLRDATWRQLVPPPLGGAQGFSDVPKYTSLFWVYLIVATTWIVAMRLKHSSTGRAFLSIREDEIAAQAMGIDLTRLKVRAFILAAFFAGIAGGLFTHQSGTVLRPIDAGFQRSFEVVIMVVLGGLGSITGVSLAAAILTLLPALLLDFAQYRMILYALLLILLMIFRPQGLLGVKEVWELRNPWHREGKRA